ncbi:glycine betaine ABC transporter substrate-binding protein [Gordonia soli]|uniref:glycine betaine ABC transporter substrate-binding protein n=1 Tax=Gordonia soli TaxID=320799 RepID=UPI00058C725F|nr:glycine betaine ABC transporter substrate-binding protein [Gordonia soli]
MIRRLVATMFPIVMVLAVVSGCGSAGTAPARELVLGAPDDPALRVVAQIYGGALRGAGAQVAERLRLADDRALLSDMDRLEVDLFPAFSGELLGLLAPEVTPIFGVDVYDELNRSLPQGVSVGDATTVSAVPQVFVAADLARTSGVTELAQCGQLPAGLPVAVVGQPDERVLRSFVDAGCRFGPVERLASSAQVLSRVSGGSAVGVVTPLDAAAGDAGAVQALSVPQPSADAPTSTATEKTDRPVIGPRAQDLVPVYRTAALTADQVKAINKVAGELTTADLATMAGQARDGTDPTVIAGGWLSEHELRN